MSFLDKRMDICRAECGNDPLGCVSDDEILSQYGEATFRNQPRESNGEPGLSTQRGEWDAATLCSQIFGTPPRSHLEMAAVRYATAGPLRAAGFVVIHTPGRIGSQKDHVTVAWAPEAGSGVVVPWPKPLPELFDACFNEIDD